MDRPQQTWQRTEFDLGVMLLLVLLAGTIIFFAWPYL
jgi:hypothetical protein